MAARSRAIIRPELVRWARESAGFSPDESADRLKIDRELYAGWEDGSEAPSIPQLRNLAELFKRPLAVFYLPEPPQGFQVMRDLRRLPGVGFRRFPPELQLEIRQASERRELAIELAEDIGEEIPTFNLTASIKENTEEVGQRIREALDIRTDTQRVWRDGEGRASLNGWRARIEGLGVLVFQTTKVSSETASGFAMWHKQLPVIAVNKKDTPTRRTFSLLHELAHLMVRVSGVSELETDVARPAEDQVIEVFCNSVAAAALMPASDFALDPRIASMGGTSVKWSDTTIADVARSFGTSREAVVRRLLELGLTTDHFYRAKRAQYAAEYQAIVERQRQKLQNADSIRRNMPQEALSNFGRPFVGMVLGNYYQDRISLNEVSGYLGLKAKHLAKLEHLAGTR